MHEAHDGRSGSQGVGPPAYDLLYLDDNNRESDVPADELRVLGDERNKYVSLELDGDRQARGVRADTANSVAEANVEAKYGEFRSEVNQKGGIFSPARSAFNKTLQSLTGGGESSLRRTSFLGR